MSNNYLSFLFYKDIETKIINLLIIISDIVVTKKGDIKVTISVYLTLRIIRFNIRKHYLLPTDSRKQIVFDYFKSAFVDGLLLANRFRR